MPSFFTINDFYIINPLSMDLLLEGIYKKRPRKFITLFLKKIFDPVCFPLDNV